MESETQVLVAAKTTYGRQQEQDEGTSFILECIPIASPCCSAPCARRTLETQASPHVALSAVVVVGIHKRQPTDSADWQKEIGQKVADATISICVQIAMFQHNEIRPDGRSLGLQEIG